MSRTEDSSTDSSAEEFWEWLRPYWPLMSRTADRLCGPSDAADILHDAALHAWRKRHLYDPGRGSPGAWLVSLTYDQARRHRRRRSRVILTSDPPESGREDGASIAARIDVEHAIRQLPRRQRETVYLYYHVDLPVADVAAVLGCSEGTVKSTLHDARIALAKSIQR
jgi:RNA polymerase sigma factor (sigma-70 family)